jgi:hypothetical protein
MKTCSRCGATKPLEAFNRRQGVPDGRQGRCSACTTELQRQHRAEHPEQHAEWARGRNADPGYRQRRARQSQEWRRANPDRVAEHRRRGRLKAYGLTPEEYEAMSAEQGHACKICKQGPVGRGQGLHVDHDHMTGRVRGLLCTRCNLMIGCALDDPKVLEAGVRYINGAS